MIRIQENGVQNESQTSKTEIIQSNSETATSNTITITAEKGETAEVTISDVNISGVSENEAAISTDGEGNVLLELDGENKAVGGEAHAGVEKNNDGNLTIADEDSNGSLTAKGTLNGAGIGGGYQSDGDNITISGGVINASSEWGAGIGGGKEGDGTNITITGGEVNTIMNKKNDYSHAYGAGIGGGVWGDGDNITISGGKVNAESAIVGGAAIGGGYRGNGSNIKITDGEVTARGYNSAAIGGGAGDGDDGTNITISGGTVNASSDYAAGIGGGLGGDGVDITISGGTVTAAGGSGSAAIGGGRFGYHTEGKAKNITISGDAQVKVRESKRGDAIAPAIGEGVTTIYDGEIPTDNINGTEVTPDTANLGENGFIAFYEVGADMNTANPEKMTHKSTEGVVTHTGDITLVRNTEATCTEPAKTYYRCSCGEDIVFVNTSSPALGHSFTNYIPNGDATYDHDGTKTAACDHGCGTTDTIPDAGSKLERPSEKEKDSEETEQSDPLYRVTDQNGLDIPHKESRENETLTITANFDFAILTGKLYGINVLADNGVEVIVFVTNGAVSTFRPADLLEKGNESDAYQLTHDSGAVTFSVGEADVISILKN